MRKLLYDFNIFLTIFIISRYFTRYKDMIIEKHLSSKKTEKIFYS